MENLISVIIPVYNVESQLDRCVESIIAQTYRNLEIILVDDGSPDSCPEKCDLWKKRDSRIKVIHKENGGLSSARNAGLEIATGEYISFVDSDDRVESIFLEKMLYHLLDTNADIVECAILQEDENGTKQLLALSGDVQKKDDARVHLLKNDKKVFSFSWNKLYRASTIGNIRFCDDLRFGEDTPFIFEVLENCKRYCQLNEPLYHYIMREDSLASGMFSPRKLGSIAAAEKILSVCEEKFPAYQELARCHLSLRCYYVLRTLLCTPDWRSDYREIYQDIRYVMKQCPLHSMYRYQGLHRTLAWWMAGHLAFIYEILLHGKNRIILAIRGDRPCILRSKRYKS